MDTGQTKEQDSGCEKPVVWSNRVDDSEPYGERFRAFVSANREEEERGLQKHQFSSDHRGNHGSYGSRGAHSRRENPLTGNQGSLPTDPMEYVKQKRQDAKQRSETLKHKMERYQDTLRNQIQEQEALLEEETQYKNTENTENAATAEKNEGNLTRVPSIKSHTSQQKENGRTTQNSSQSSRGSSASTMEGKQDSSQKKH